jgi:hypothetical protein
VDLQDLLEGVGELWKPVSVFRRPRRFPRVLAEAILLVEQRHQGFLVQLGEAVAVPLNRAALVRSPPQDQVGPEQLQEHGRSLRRIRRQVHLGIGTEPGRGRGAPVGLVPLHQQGDAR